MPGETGGAYAASNLAAVKSCLAGVHLSTVDVGSATCTTSTDFGSGNCVGNPSTTTFTFGATRVLSVAEATPRLESPIHEPSITHGTSFSIDYAGLVFQTTCSLGSSFAMGFIDKILDALCSEHQARFLKEVANVFFMYMMGQSTEQVVIAEVLRLALRALKMPPQYAQALSMAVSVSIAVMGSGVVMGISNTLLSGIVTAVAYRRGNTIASAFFNPVASDRSETDAVPV
jgi:hypothetical protein